MFPATPLPRHTLVAGGHDDRALDRALMSGRLVAPFRGVLLDAAVPLDLMARARAALATQGHEAALAHETAAVLLGLRWCPQGWRAPDSVVHLTVPPADDHRHRAGLRLHRAVLREDEVVSVHGMRCTAPARTLVDLARRREARRLTVVQLIDGARRDERCDERALLAVLDRVRGERFTRRARNWVADSADGVDSPPETQVRLTLRDGGCAVEPDVRIHDHDGMLLARGDFGCRRLMLWGEYDGFDTHVQRAAFRNDRVGDRWLERRGWQVMRFVDDDLKRGDRILAEWREAERFAPARIAAMDPRRSPELAEAHRLLGLLP